MLIGIATIAGGSEDFMRACAPCLESVAEYANIHGYPRFLWDGEGLDRPISWGRIPLMLTIFEEHPELTHLLWFDADAMVTNPKIKLEPFAKIMDKHDKVAFFSIDGANNLNDGMALYKNSYRTKEILHTLWNMEEYINHPWWVNAAICRYNIDNFDRKDILIANNSNFFNSYVYGRNPWSFGDFVVHFAGMDNNKRRIFSLAFMEMIKSLKDLMPEKNIEDYYYGLWET